MTQREIFDKYLPMLQHLQQVAAGRKDIEMNIRVKPSSFTVSIDTLNEDGKLKEFEMGIFDTDYTEAELNQRFVSLSAFFAKAVTVSAPIAKPVTGTEASINLSTLTAN